MTTNLSYVKNVTRELLWWMIRKYHPKCYFCDKPFVLSDILPPRGLVRLTIHHKNGIHRPDLDQEVLAHPFCHRSYHSKDNINKGR